jgi:cobalt-precorrin-5B (C1)-methyltransferase
MSETEISLRRGWTTGACATAAAKAAFTALITGQFPDPVEITLPKGQRVSFSLAKERLAETSAMAAVIKDAGDDPDVTHGALIVVTISIDKSSSAISFRSGNGVGTVTKVGLPIGVGEPAINPVPREMIKNAILEVAKANGTEVGVKVEVSIPGGEEIAQKTWNPRLGIVGGLSILGTTGIVIPFSCSAWIHSIHRGIDVARAAGVAHVGACTGSTSETAVRQKYGLPESSILDMGDFVGGALKYLRRHPIPRITIGGGFGKISKLGQGHLDLHSGRSQVDLGWLAKLAASASASDEVVDQIYAANTAMEVLAIASQNNLHLADLVASEARIIALDVLSRAPVAVEVLIFDRSGQLVGAANGW